MTTLSLQTASAIVLGTLCMTVTAAVEDPAPQTRPIATIAVSDGPVLTRHVDESIYMRLWSDASMQPLHAGLTDVLARTQEDLGIDPLTLIASMRSLSVRVTGMTAIDGKPQPVVMAQAELGEAATRLFALLRQASWAQAAIAGADESLASDDGVLHIARFGTEMRAAINTDQMASWRSDLGEADIAIRLDVPRLVAEIMPTLAAGDASGPVGRRLEWLKNNVGVITSDTRVTADGMADRIVAAVPTAGLVPVDRAALARVPANALSCTAVGFDGAAWWKAFREPLLDLIGAADPASLDAAAVEKRADETLSAAGFPKLGELIEGISGTQLFIMTPAAPIPGYSLVMRRSPAIDRAVGAILALIGQEPPAEDSAIMISIPNLPMMPVAPQLALDRDTWLLSTDAVLTSQWATSAGGWVDSPTGKAALAHADGNAFLISGSDMAAMVRTASGFASIGINSARGLDPAQRRAILQGLNRLATLAKPAYAIGRTTATGIEIDMESLLGSTAQLAIVAAIAIPNLLESRVSANESAAAATLRSGFLPAQVQFQAGGYMDLDQNGIGEYGFPSEMTGAEPVNGITLNLLAPHFTDLSKPVAGYTYAVHLPDGAGGAISTKEKRPADPALSGEREKRWLAYAWPVDRKNGRRMFAIDQSGQVYTAPFTGIAPAWNSLYGGKTWTDAPTWQRHDRRQRGRRRPDVVPPTDPNPAGARDF
ncbi:MAG: hypothetical protein H0V44_06330 [Planctomycetes bacterium]|nr:hypothetical protein [Planctomycetota bacterium]